MNDQSPKLAEIVRKNVTLKNHTHKLLTCFPNLCLESKSDKRIIYNLATLQHMAN